MNLIRRSEFPSLTSFQDEVNQLFNRFFGTAPLVAGSAWLPLVNVEDHDREVVVSAELPGVDPKDVTLTIEGRELVLAGEKKSSKSERKPNYYREEICYGSFLRRVPLPADVVVDKSTADYKAGVLRVTLPKTEAAKRAKIPIATAKD